jgi:hypothetical protein
MTKIIALAAVAMFLVAILTTSSTFAVEDEPAEPSGYGKECGHQGFPTGTMDSAQHSRKASVPTSSPVQQGSTQAGSGRPGLSFRHIKTLIRGRLSAAVLHQFWICEFRPNQTL